MSIAQTLTNTRFFFKSKTVMLLVEWCSAEMRREIKRGEAKYKNDASARDQQSGRTVWGVRRLVMSRPSLHQLSISLSSPNIRSPTPWGCHGRSRHTRVQLGRGKSTSSYWRSPITQVSRDAYMKSQCVCTSATPQAEGELVRDILVLRLRDVLE